MRTIDKITCQRQGNGPTATKTRYYISSLGNDAVQILGAVRGHWGVENSLHRVLDVAMSEDASRIRKDHALENMALLRRVALTLLQQEKSLKRGVQGKQLKAAMNPSYLLRFLSA